MDHIAQVDVRVPLVEESRGDVDRDDKGARFVDIPCHSHETSLKGLVETGSEHAVDHHVAFAEGRWVERMRDFSEIDTVHREELAALLVAVVREVAADVEEEDLNVTVSLLNQHAGHSERIAAVVARTCYDHHALARQKS